ncbi:MAG: hypothetical protein GTO41_26560 [Burkholderiales bacterium]|nr:hypothetical protein [Burkholderiales bacterium]
MGNFVRAIERYNQALPLNAPVWGQTLPIRGCRGDAWRALGKPKRALKDWMAAFQSDGIEEVRRWQGRFKSGSLAASALENGVIDQEVRRTLAAYAHDRAE